MGNSQSSPDEGGLVHRAECREIPTSSCFKTEVAFQNQYPLGEKMSAAGLTPAAFQQELEQVNAIWTASVGGAKVAYESLSLMGIVIGVAIVIITTLTSDSCTTTSRSSTRRSSSTSCSEIPGGAIIGFILLGLGFLVFIVAACIRKQKVDAAMAAIGTHLNTVVAPRWAGMGIGWRTGSYSERTGKNSHRTIYYIEAFLSPEAMQRVHVGMTVPTASVVQQPMHGGAPWQGGYVPTAQEAQGQPMMMPIMPQPGGAFPYPPPAGAGAPMPGGYPYGGAQGGQAATYDGMDKPTSGSAPTSGGPYTLPPDAANYAYSYGGYPPPPAPGLPGAGSAPGQPQAWQQQGGGPGAGQAPGHAAFGYAGSAPPVSDRTL